MAIRGSCLCGAVTFKLHTPTKFFSHCHCETCRRAHGAAFVSWTGVPDDCFEWLTGAEQLTGYRSSEHATRSFCSRCGTHVRYVSTDWPGTVYVPVATLSDPMDRDPEDHIHAGEAVSWCSLNDELPRYLGFGEDD
ncbi:MAG: GFA family protein [bacterium]|nr:GFA family protein [bacterium]